MIDQVPNPDAIGDEQVYKKDLDELIDYIMQPGSGQSGASSNVVDPKEKKPKKKRNRKKDGLGEGVEETIAGGTTGGSSTSKDLVANREEQREDGRSSGEEGIAAVASLTTAVFGRDEVVPGVGKGLSLSDE